MQIPTERLAGPRSLHFTTPLGDVGELRGSETLALASYGDPQTGCVHGDPKTRLQAGGTRGERRLRAEGGSPASCPRIWAPQAVER